MLHHSARFVHRYSGGYSNIASGQAATASGGRDNIASEWAAIVSGGTENTASGSEAVVGGGNYNIASGSRATVSGGHQNIASNQYTTIGGGEPNGATADHATVGGGHQNTVTGYAAAIVGGYENGALGDCSFAAGTRVTIDTVTDYTFASGRDFTTSTPNAVIFHNSVDAIKIGAGTPSPTATLDVNGSAGYNQLRMRTSYTPTDSLDANGNVGDIAWDDNYIYIKTSAGWKRASLSTW